ncbi:type II toxin-antitoxin system RelE/ParE family toxin [Candidatus Kaiserbacteria bacterium]|nr:type II toxin-antitoxin system RelE/ParE family toxin [Candidatus Kaiserbacteria bacterium]
MSFRVDFSDEAIVQIDEFFEYLARYSEGIAEKYYAAFQQAIDYYLVNYPETFTFYKETGSPYRAFLFTVSQRTSYWIIYRVYEEKRLVRVFRFWNSARKPHSHRLI